MSRKVQPRHEVSFSVEKDKILKNTIQASSQRIVPSGVVNTFTYNNQILSEHNRSPLVKVIPEGLYRRPAPYRVFALKVVPELFDFQYYIGTGLFRAWGVTDRAAGFGGPFYGYLGTKLSGGLRVPDVSQNKQNQVITEAKNKLQNGNLNLLTSLAEAKEAFGFAAAVLKSIADVMRRFLGSQSHNTAKIDRAYTYYDTETYIFKQRLPSGDVLATIRERRIKRTSHEFHDVRDARSFLEKHDDLLDSAEKAWLNVMYAVFPLISDFQAFIEAAKQKLQKNGAHITVLRSISWQGDLPTAPVGYPTWSWSGEWRQGAECQLSYRIADSHLHYLSSLGLENPLAVFWEVTPYSFVVDWLVPISNWIQSLTSDVGLDFKDGFVNTKNVLNAGLTCANYVGKGKLPFVLYQQVCQFRYTLVTSPMPGLYMKSPFTSGQRAVSAIALAAQALR